MSNFYITAIRTKSGNPSFITDVLVHSPVSAGRLSNGRVFTKDEVISSLSLGHTFKTATYNYTTGSWSNGANVGTVRIGYVTYLRTDRDSTARDNLGNLLLIDEIR
ncbi:DUF3892 domain-containing protein [Chryseobacterium foetidum]|uniref:DUF3892 domain-containing protein n=1 Tax=Chryseobacterium foetidum TaxID=2951057 RepID=UPI0021C5DFB0|nr:DUF3892 domain-containing protein [Chryseobacterium foetidum]